MAGPLRICLWATTFQSDIYTLARYLHQQEDFQVMVAMADVEGFRREPIHVLQPLDFPLLEKKNWLTPLKIHRFRPQITVVDNHYPKWRLSPYLFTIWHGQSWKGPQDRREFDDTFRQIKRLTGIGGDEPNRFFRWSCAGPTEVEHRAAVTGFARENLVSVGYASVDDILGWPFSREQMLRFYPPSFATGKICLFAPTWHYARIFPYGEDDLEVFHKFFNLAADEGVSVILRMHDRMRFDGSYLAALEALTRKHDNVLIKYKNESRDSLLDMMVADFAVSNYSSLLTYYYATGRPSVHIYPIRPGDESFMYRAYSGGKVRTVAVGNERYVWRRNPSEIGGLAAKTYDELCHAFRRASAEPDCCQALISEFLSRHMLPYDGRACERTADVLRQMVR
nr:hypothetical protein [uncultured Desulfobulbus sp.]